VTRREKQDAEEQQEAVEEEEAEGRI